MLLTPQIQLVKLGGQAIPNGSAVWPWACAASRAKIGTSQARNRTGKATATRRSTAGIGCNQARLEVQDEVVIFIAIRCSEIQVQPRLCATRLDQGIKKTSEVVTKILRPIVGAVGSVRSRPIRGCRLCHELGRHSFLNLDRVTVATPELVIGRGLLSDDKENGPAVPNRLAASRVQGP